MTLPTCVLAEMYLVIPGRDVVVTLPTCVLAEMYPTIPGRDIPSHSVTGCTWPFLAGMWLASFPTRYEGIIWFDEASFPIDIDMGGSSSLMKLPFP
ncbi:hypothetical protein DEO72_LG5g994 [Vigna unguiculata]|uniref:Uncharacterized protein n=1 Tax=Vigna unguiculata TaxID=3917 RepID=A0A4D6LW85_VIGUN|nr:hypothetical protein DEO72_LG5g994 [Vigna unguiculata]